MGACGDPFLTGRLVLVAAWRESRVVPPGDQVASPMSPLPQWDPYPGTIRGNARCFTCGVGPIAHPFDPEACGEYLAPVPASIAHLDPDGQP